MCFSDINFHLQALLSGEGCPPSSHPKGGPCRDGANQLLLSLPSEDLQGEAGAQEGGGGHRDRQEEKLGGGGGEGGL